MAEIQGKIIKQGKRNAISQHFHARDDKDKLTAWRLDLDRILQVFNVCPTVTVRRLLTLYSQTELAIDTNVTVTETHAIVSGLERNAMSTHVMVSNIHRTIVEGQGGNLLVSDMFSIYHRITIHRGID